MEPITKEETWLRVLSGVEAWKPGMNDLLLIAPHPDDEILGTGGLIAEQRRKNARVTVIAVTDGEAAYPQSAGLAETRRAEQERALALVGVSSRDIIRLRLPDGNVALHEQELTKVLLSLLQRNSAIVAPWSLDPHPDHEACGRAAEVAARTYGALLVSYFFWTWHRFLPQALQGLALQRFELDPDLQEVKAAALGQYRSQFQHNGDKPSLPELLLVPARRPFETFVVHAGRA